MRFTAICLGALALVGCGADEVRETVDPVAEAADKMAASGGARVDGDMTIRLPGVEIPMTLDGVVSFEDGRAQFVMDLDEAGIVPRVNAKEIKEGRRDAQLPLRTIMTTEETYLSTPRVLEEGREDGLIRREEMTYSFEESGQTAKTRVVLDFMEVGTPQEIELPDDDEVQDISDELAEQLGRVY